MKLYLSSYRIGNESHKLKELVGPNIKTALIPNALDMATDMNRRSQSLQKDKDDLVQAGLGPEELDLKDYFGKPDSLRYKLKEYGLIYVRGGNTFVLRRAMDESGFDVIIKDLAKTNDIVYGGYSAGVCVITPTLKGLETVDDPTIIPPGYKDQTIWEGLNLINYSFAPHYRSDHPESADVEKEVQYMIDNKILFKALRDGEVLIEETK
jgi:dipeptidase E